MDARFALLLACFFTSGFAALLYQTAWSRELSFVFGTSELAVAAVLAAYMGGLALGAAAAARFAARLRRPVLTYGILELAIAVCALAVPWGIRGLRAVYVGVLGGGNDLGAAGSNAATAIQLAGAFAVLLPPTAFMGATLPLLARHAVHREDEIASRVGVLYAVNTAGAIAGTLCAAFWLMPALGLRLTVWSGAALNALVFGLAVMLARSAPIEVEQTLPPSRARAAPRSLWILPAIALSGAVSFAYEVMWTRLLGHLLGASIHAFATMLASFLLGIALGSAVAARFASTRQRAALGFSLCQLGIAATSYAAFALSDWLPLLSAHLGAGPARPLANAAVAGAALLPITLCIGATFPLAVRVRAGGPEGTATATARVYAWNTVGAIAGALGAGFLLLPAIGFEGLASAGILMSLGLAALAALAADPRRVALVGVAAAAVLSLWLAPPRTPWGLLLSSPMKRQLGGEIVSIDVGRSTTVTLLDWREKFPNFQILTDGLPEAFVNQRGLVSEINVAHWLGALPALVRPDAREMLVVGLGGGVALEQVPSSIAEIDVIELEPKVLEANRRIAGERQRDPLSDPRVEVHIGDARGTLQLTARRYDAIVSQPSHPWTAGASHLYTKEFFALARSRLFEDGVFVQWIGTTFVDEALLRSLLAALTESFPHVEVFHPQQHGLLFVASGSPIDAIAGAAKALASAPEEHRRLGLHRLEDFASAWALDDAGVRALIVGAPANSDDRNLLAAHSAGLGDAMLDPESLRSLLSPYDPLSRAEGLDRSALVRSLIIRRQVDRASDVAMAADGAPEEAALGWIEISKSRSGRAARHFERALQLDPEHADALAGLIASRQDALAGGVEVPGISDRELRPGHAALIEGWRRAELRDHEGTQALLEDLSRVRPGDPLFDAAARVRVEALIASGEAAKCSSAQELAETLLIQSQQFGDHLLRARAALCSGQVRDAWASLQRVASLVGPNQRDRASVERILEVARDLPAKDQRALQEQLRTAIRIRRAGFRADPLRTGLRF